MKPFEPGLSFKRLLLTDLISFLVIGLFKFPISSWVVYVVCVFLGVYF